MIGPAAWLDPILADAHVALVTHPDAADARAYLASRAVSPNLIRRYRIGFGLASLGHPCTPSFLHFANRHWAGCLVFPITSVLGHVVGVQTRPVTRKNYQVFAAIPKDLYPLAFGLAQAMETIWQTRRVVIVEGVFDLLAVADLAPEVIAILTARVPQVTQRFLARWATQVVALLDMDRAGRAGVARLAGPYVLSAPSYPAHDVADLKQAPHGFDLRRLLQ
jgi:DNA primase